MTFELYTKVLIVSKGIYGEVIDTVTGDDGTLYYLVESDTPAEKPDPDSVIDSCWPLYECPADDLKKV